MRCKQWDPKDDYALSLLIAGLRCLTEEELDGLVPYIPLANILACLRGWDQSYFGFDIGYVARALEDAFVRTDQLDRLQEIRTHWRLPPLVTKTVTRIVREEEGND